MRSSPEPSFTVPLRPLHWHGMMPTYKQFSVAMMAAAMSVTVVMVLVACIVMETEECHICASSMILLAGLYGLVCYALICKAVFVVQLPMRAGFVRIDHFRFHAGRLTGWLNLDLFCVIISLMVWRWCMLHWFGEHGHLLHNPNVLVTINNACFQYDFAPT